MIYKEGKTALMLAQDLGFDDVAEALLAVSCNWFR
jgi:hypothetical protein